MRKRLSQEQKEEIKIKKNQGISATELAKEYGVALPTVYNILRKNNDPSEALEADEFLKAVQKLERDFPGAIDKIKKGFVCVKSVVELNRY